MTQCGMWMNWNTGTVSKIFSSSEKKRLLTSFLPTRLFEPEHRVELGFLKFERDGARRHEVSPRGPHNELFPFRNTERFREKELVKSRKLRNKTIRNSSQLIAAGCPRLADWPLRLTSNHTTKTLLRIGWITKKGKSTERSWILHRCITFILMQPEILLSDCPLPYFHKLFINLGWQHTLSANNET